MRPFGARYRTNTVVPTSSPALQEPTRQGILDHPNLLRTALHTPTIHNPRTVEQFVTCPSAALTMHYQCVNKTKVLETLR